MSFNSFGHLFRITTWGESHGPAIGCVVDGCPPGIQLDVADIQTYLDKRRPGQSRYTTQRKEPDQVRILSGVFTDEASGEQVTTGTPIALEIDNLDARFGKSALMGRTRMRAAIAITVSDRLRAWRTPLAGYRDRLTEQVFPLQFGGAAGTLAAVMARERVHPTNDQRSNGGSVAAMRAPSRRNPVTPMAARSARIPSAMLLRSSLGGLFDRERKRVCAIVAMTISVMSLACAGLVFLIGILAE